MTMFAIEKARRAVGSPLERGVRLPAKRAMRARELPQMPAMATVSEILRAAKPAPQITGIYFLICGAWPTASIEYVGQSVDVYSRVAQHMASKRFDAWSYVACDVEQLDLLESLYIHWLQPSQQGRKRGKSLSECCAPIAHSEVHHLIKRLPARRKST